MLLKRIFRFIFHHRDEEARRRNARHVSTVSFLLGFTDSFYGYVLSLYFAEVTGSDNVGVFYLASFGIIFVLLWFLHRIMRRIGGSILTFLLSILAGLTLAVAISAVPTGWLGAVLAVLLLVAVNLAWVALDVALEQVSDDGVTGRVRGLYLTVMNAGILLAPLVATRVIDFSGFGGIFFGVTLGLAVVLGVSIILLRNCADCSSAKMEVRSAWRKMLEDRNLFHIYNVAFGLGFFYVVMIIYTPIRLVQLGFDWGQIGFLFTVMLLPFVLFQYPLGHLADRRYGEKELLLVSIAITACSTLALGLSSSTSLLFWGVLLFVSRIGAAGIEVLRDSYFYKHVDGHDDDLIAFFRTAYPLANIVGALLATPLLLFFPLPSVFVLAALVLAFSFVSALLIQDTR